MMPSEISKTASRCTVERARGTHTFLIVGYEDIKPGEPVLSATFTVGGYDWAIGFYRDGCKEVSRHCGLVFLRLMNNKSEVRGVYDLRLVNQVTGLSKSMMLEGTPKSFMFRNGTHVVGQSMIRSDLVASGCIQDDCLTVECALTVIKEPCTTKTLSHIQVPPSELSDHFSKLLSEQEGADVTFSVGEETFAAHKIVLATRSPVFKAEFYGQMKEGTASHVTIQDMQPAVFKALLHFIYTDSLPADMPGVDEDGDSEMIWHLLVAADRYAMDRLKLMCQSFLHEYYIDAETVATTLALADQHNCDKLKDACIEFIASSEDAVVATKGYANLKRTCPSVLIDALEKAHKFRKT